jgi:precorrin-4 methylase
MKRLSRAAALTLAPLLLSPLLCAHGENTGKLYVVGMGPAGPDLTAPRALSIVEKADVILCSPRMPERFARFGAYIDPSKVAFDPWEGIFTRQSGKNDSQSRAAAREKQIEKVQEFVLDKVTSGKTVVMMDGGDACIYGPTLSHLLVGLDDRHYEVVPGMGAFNAAAAALKRSMTCQDTRFVMLTSPRSLFGDGDETKDNILEDISKYKTTMVLYMSLRNMKDVAEKFRSYYPPDLPIAVIYYAGYTDKERVLRSTLATIDKDISAMDEKWLGLVVIGECVR